MRNGRDHTNSPPVVLLCTRPTRPHSVHRKRKGTASFVPRDERLECMSENPRRAMDCIDAVCYSDSANSTILQDEVVVATKTTELASEERTAFTHRPKKNTRRTSEEADVVHHPAHLFDLGDSIPQIPQVRKATVRAIEQEPHMRHVGHPTSGVEISVEVREPVAQLYKALVEDQGHVTSEAPGNQPNLNPPPDWHKHKKPLQQPAMKSPRDNGVQVQDHHFPGTNKTDPLPAKLQTSETILYESVEVDRPHVAQDTSDGMGKAERRPKSTYEFSEMSRPKSRGSRAAGDSSEQQHRSRTTPSGLAFRDRRLSERVAWHFRSDSPGPGGAAYARPVNTANVATSFTKNPAMGQLLTSAVTYIGGSHTSIGDPQKSVQHTIQDWPTSLRKSLWNSMSSKHGLDKGTQVPDTQKRLRMLCESPTLAAQLFAQYAIPMRLAGEPVLLLIPFLDCLVHLEALEGSSPVLNLALEMAGVQNHQREAISALISKDEATLIFEGEASWYCADLCDAETASESRKNAGFFGLNKEKFSCALSHVSKVLDDKHHTLIQAMPKWKGGNKQKRLPINDLRELRGQPRKDLKTQDPGRRPLDFDMKQDDPDVKCPMEMLSAMNKEGAAGDKSQAALFRALRSRSAVSEYKMLARQVARETMMQLDAAVKTKTRTRKELEWLLILRDQALTSLGLIVADDIKAAAVSAAARDDTKIFDKFLEDGDDQSKILALGPASWAWVVPLDIRKPVSPVLDGWYLVSGDPGPALRLMGPARSRASIIKCIPDFMPLSIKIFNVFLMRDSSAVETFAFDASGRSIEHAPKNVDAKSDGWYVMIHASEKRLWTLGLDLTQINRELQECKKNGTRARKTLSDLQVAHSPHCPSCLVVVRAATILILCDAARGVADMP